ncbi:hypothetical protein [Chitinophaga alhagiae]|uniref:hypothetical protein n=1 Tax=Chitinophaga alhagiae TaxID=2203219 RepID=UPI000E5AF626|nr:hypothetical protein [Chitinophaga alhagiae]
MKRIFLAVIFLALGQAVFAQSREEEEEEEAGPPRQEQEKGFNPRNLMVGGALGMAFGDYTFVNVSPMIGYRFSRLFAAGVNVNAQYSSGKSYGYDNAVLSRNKYTMFGGGLWGRFYPLDMLFIHAQPEYNFISAKITEYEPDRREYKDRYGAPSLLLGGGYSQPVGGNSAVTIMVLYDVLQDKNTPYLNRPIISGGVNIGL